MEAEKDISSGTCSSTHCIAHICLVSLAVYQLIMLCQAGGGFTALMSRSEVIEKIAPPEGAKYP